MVVLKFYHKNQAFQPEEKVQFLLPKQMKRDTPTSAAQQPTEPSQMVGMPRDQESENSQFLRTSALPHSHYLSTLFGLSSAHLSKPFIHLLVHLLNRALPFTSAPQLASEAQL